MWWQKKKSLHCPFQEWNPSHPACNLVSVLTEQFQLKNEIVLVGFTYV
jgi:hypothetical protein